MLDADIAVACGKPGIGQRRPALPPAGEQGGIVPLPRLRAKTALGADMAERQQNMGVQLRQSVAAACEMHGKIGDHSQANTLRPREIPRQRDVRRKREFPRKGDLDLAGHLRVAPALARIHGIP